MMLIQARGQAGSYVPLCDIGATEHGDPLNPKQADSDCHDGGRSPSFGKAAEGRLRTAPRISLWESVLCKHELRATLTLQIFQPHSDFYPFGPDQ